MSRRAHAAPSRKLTRPDASLPPLSLFNARTVPHCSRARTHPRPTARPGSKPTTRRRCSLSPLSKSSSCSAASCSAPCCSRIRAFHRAAAVLRAPRTDSSACWASSLLAPLFFAHFLRLRYYLSPPTRKAFAWVSHKVDLYTVQNSKCPPVVTKGVKILRELVRLDILPPPPPQGGSYARSARKRRRSKRRRARAGGKKAPLQARMLVSVQGMPRADQPPSLDRS